jgi:hypothetical protein
LAFFIAIFISSIAEIYFDNTGNVEAVQAPSRFLLSRHFDNVPLWPR